MTPTFLDPSQMDRLHQYCRLALAHHPLDTQFEHMAEEMAELTLARARLWRGRSTDEDVLEELVDVFMCAVEMGVHHFGAERFNAVFARKNDKFRTALIEAGAADDSLI